MPRYLIERRIPNAGEFNSEQLQAISAKSNSVLHDMQRQGTHVQWIQSYVVDDAIYCVYVAPNPESVHEHARCGDFRRMP
jgi:hypothetical protein